MLASGIMPTPIDSFTILASRLRQQSPVDQRRPYAVFASRGVLAVIDYSMLIKLYGQPAGNRTRLSHRVHRTTVNGALLARPKIRCPPARSDRWYRRSRSTRLTTFSKKLENHKHQVALHFMHYNFARIHQTLRVTPAMEAGISERVIIEELAALIP